MSRPLLIEGYASLFGVADASGDVVRAGAFARSLREDRTLPMLLQHRSGAVAGRWTRMIEDGRGLYVRGLAEADGALALADKGLDGLSIGFRPRLWRARTGRGRELIEVELVEVSLVAAPMLAQARFALVGAWADPWPGRVRVLAGLSPDAVRERAVLTQPAVIGRLTEATGPGPVGRWDRANRLVVTCPGGEFASLPEAHVLGGGNLALLETVAG